MQKCDSIANVLALLQQMPAVVAAS